MSRPLHLTPPGSAEWVRLSTGHAATVTRPSVPRGTAVLVPGFTGSKEDFWPILDDLTAAGWAVCAIDQRGQMDSPGRSDAGYDLATLADDVRSIAADVISEIGQSGQPFHIVGHSLGGLVAAEAVRQGLRPTSLTLLCSGPGPLPDSRRGPLGALIAVLPDMPLDQVWTVIEQMERAAGNPAPPPEVAAFLRERFTASDPLALKGMAQLLLSVPDDIDALAATGVRTHVVYGADDDAWPLAEQDDMARRLGTTSMVIPRSAHSPAVEAPSATAALLDRLWST